MKTTLLFVSLAVSSSLSAQNVVFVDDMTDTFYSSFSFNGFDSGSNPDDVSYAYSQEEISGGNPGAKLDIFHEHDVDRDEFGEPFGGNSFTEIQSFFDWGDVSYTPSTQGVIQELAFSLDIKTSDPIDTLFFTVNDQFGGNTAKGITGGGFLDVTTDGEWQTITLSGVTQADVGSRDLSGSVPLQFGFGFLSSTDVFSEAEFFQAQVDNFRIEINPIPEPSSALLIALGFAGLTRRRR